MFWGITIENGKRYSQIVDNSFHVSMAALECTSEDNSKKSKPISVMIEHEKTEYLLCTLNYNSQVQQALDLNFIEGEEVTFFINGHGPGAVHLTGYLMDSNEDMNDSSDMEMEEESEEELENMSGPNLKRKNASDMENMKKLKKKKVDMSKEFAYIVDRAADDDSDVEKSEDESIDADEKELTMSSKKAQSETKEKKINFNQKQRLNLESSMQKTPKSAPQFQGNQNKTPKLNENKGPQSAKKTPGGKPNNIQEKQLTETPQNGLNASPNEEGTKKKKKKKKKKKNKNLNESMDSSQNESRGNMGTPEVASPNQKSKPNTPKTPAQKKPGGTVVEDVTIGSGPVAKDGKFVHITYEGKLQNNKVFDSAKKDPLKFRLGKGEVIKGMDIGVEGMKVGGKRRITIPSNQGYGTKQVGPIPANSTLIFDIELKAVS